MPRRKQNAIVAACTVAMLLLLGLYILDLNNAFARSSTLASSQSQTQAMYRHPIVAYEKLTALGANQLRADYPLEHYQTSSSNTNQPLQQQQQQMQQPLVDEFGDMPLVPLQPPGVHHSPFGSQPPTLSSPPAPHFGAPNPLHPNFGAGVSVGQLPPAPPLNPQSQSLQPQQQLTPRLQSPNAARPPLSHNALFPMHAHQIIPPAPPLHQKQQQPPDKSKLLVQSPPMMPPPPSPTSPAPSFAQQPPPPPLSASSSDSVTSNPPATSAASNSSAGGGVVQTGALFYSEDAEHPVKEIMRAIESYAVDKPLEQLFPQSLVQLHLSSAALDGRLANASPAHSFRQVLLDSLQPSISVLIRQQQQSSSNNSSSAASNAALFPSGSYESLCRSSAYITHPKRGKTLTGQWKTIVNLPGHKYRGVAISQMVRVEECSSQQTECALTVPQQQSLQPQQQQQSAQQQATAYQLTYLPKSRCLQHFGNQQLVAWSPQLGFHVDIFRFPNACSCHMKR